MDRKLVRDKTEQFLQGRWGNIIIVKIISGLITMAVSAIFIIPLMVTFIGTTRVNIEMSSMGGEPNPFVILGAITTMFASMAVVLTLTGLIHRLISGGLDIAIMKSYEDGERISFGTVFNHAKDNFVAILIISFAISFITYIAGKIPFIGLILTIFITYSTIFAYALIGDNSAKDGIEALKMSYEKTKGNVLDLFLISLYYTIRPLIGLLVVLVGMMFLMVSEVFAGLIILVGFVMMIVLGIKYIPYSAAAPIMFYESLKEESQPRESFEDVVDVEVVVEEEVEVEVEVVEPEVVDPADQL